MFENLDGPRMNWNKGTMNNDIVTQSAQIVHEIETSSHDFTQFNPRMKQDEEVGYESS